MWYAILASKLARSDNNKEVHNNFVLVELTSLQLGIKMTPNVGPNYMNVIVPKNPYQLPL